MIYFQRITSKSVLFQWNVCNLFASLRCCYSWMSWMAITMMFGWNFTKLICDYEWEKVWPLGRKGVQHNWVIIVALETVENCRYFKTKFLTFKGNLQFCYSHLCCAIIFAIVFAAIYFEVNYDLINRGTTGWLISTNFRTCYNKIITNCCIIKKFFSLLK